MGIFRSIADYEMKQREQEEQKRAEAELNELYRRIRGLVRFPGDLSEYISLMRADYEIMDTRRPEKFVIAKQKKHKKHKKKDYLRLF